MAVWKIPASHARVPPNAAAFTNADPLEFAVFAEIDISEK
jgi:hypothetical protein